MSLVTLIVHKRDHGVIEKHFFLLYFSNWWPLFVLLFHVLSPIPSYVARRYHEHVEASSALIEVCTFITACIVVSAYGLPIVLAHSHNIVSNGTV